ncbi:hypothetical protein LCGC14_1343120 [marine sediment metagenome]|uniref:Uncharacterized protein n=1 Tax=marine sediment metagenome TaxID=412755 RepID=A0A0F9KD17_9ZZZZ
MLVQQTYGLPFGLGQSAEIVRMAGMIWGELDKLETMGDNPAKFTSVLTTIFKRYNRADQDALVQEIQRLDPSGQFGVVVRVALEKARGRVPGKGIWGVIAIVTVITVGIGAYLIVR